MPSLRVADLMTKDVDAVAPHASLEEVAMRMRDNQHSCIVVCEEELPVGVISERDISRVLADMISGKRGAPRTAADVMSFPVTPIDENASLSLAIAECRARRIRRLPVVDADGCLVGLVTQTDLLRAHARELQLERDRLDRMVEERTRELQTRCDDLKALSLTDDRLKIGNRSAMDFALERVHGTAARYRRGYSIALIEPDHLDEYRREYGDDAAEDALERIAACAVECVRDADSLYRFQNETMLALLPETDTEGVEQVGERIRKKVEDLRIEHDGSPSGFLTVSIGLAAWNPARPSESCEALISRAERGLFRATQGGRNRVSTDPDPLANE